ncbi:MAG: hypothetical protein V4659_04110 [Pseudomonadota bacterium]
MDTFFERFDAERAKAEATEAGQAFLQNGFEVWHSGGGMTCWRKVVGANECLASDDDSAIDTGGPWGVGLYALADGDIISEDEQPDWQAAISAIKFLQTVI